MAAPILLITAAGAAFGGVLGASELTGFIADNLSTLGLGIFVPFIIATALKTAQGSSTVAIITTAALIAPMLESLGLDGTMGDALMVFAIGAAGRRVRGRDALVLRVGPGFAEAPTRGPREGLTRRDRPSSRRPPSTSC